MVEPSKFQECGYLVYYKCQGLSSRIAGVPSPSFVCTKKGKVIDKKKRFNDINKDFQAALARAGRTSCKILSAEQRIGEEWEKVTEHSASLLERATAHKGRKVPRLFKGK